MTQDAPALRAMWMSESAARPDDLRSAVERVLDTDRAERARERRLRIGGATAMLFLVPVLIWATVYGISPLVRVAYALMAAGCIAGVTAEWLYLEWSRRGLPGPADTRSQLQKSAFMLACQVWLARTAALWASPVFVGGLLISIWLYRERTVAGAVALGAFDIAAWIGCGVLAGRARAVLDRRQRDLDVVLADLSQE